MRAVNLLPPDTRGASKASAELGAGPEAKGGAGAFVVLGVLAACVAGVAGHVLSSNTIKQRQADLAEVTVRQQALQSQADAAEALRRLRRGRQGPRADRPRPRRVPLRLGAGRCAISLAPSRPTSRCCRSPATSAPTPVAVAASSAAAISAPAITIAGCAPGQTQVARLMARLHDIDGVTRVSLSKSTAEEVEARRRPAAAEVDAAQRRAVRRRQAPVVRDGHVLREGRRGCGVHADDRERHGRRDRRPRRPPPTPAPGTTAAASTTTTTTQAPGRGNPVSRIYPDPDRRPSWRSAPSSATGSSSWRPSAPRPPSWSRRSPPSRRSSRRLRA